MCSADEFPNATCTIAQDIRSPETVTLELSAGPLPFRVTLSVLAKGMQVPFESSLDTCQASAPRVQENSTLLHSSPPLVYAHAAAQPRSSQRRGAARIPLPTGTGTALCLLPWEERGSPALLCQISSVCGLRGCSPGQQGWHGASCPPCRSCAPWDAHQAQGGSQPFKVMSSASALTFFLLSLKVNLIFLFFNGDLLFAYSILPITSRTKFLYAEFVQCSIFTKL